MQGNEIEQRHKKRSAKMTPVVVVALSIAAIIQSIAILRLSNTTTPEPPVYSVDATGSITELIAVGYTSKTGVTLSNFAAMSATYCMSLGFSDYQIILDECEDIYFSSLGAQQFKRALVRAGIAKDLQSQDLIQRATLAGTPTIVDPGRQNNQSAFVIDVPMFIAQDKSTGKYNTYGIATVTISTVDNKRQLDQYRVIGFNFSFSQSL